MENFLIEQHMKRPCIFIVLIFSLSLVSSTLISLIADAPDLRNGQLASLGEWFPYFVIFFLPAIETFLCQLIPALVIDIYSLSTLNRITAITLPFALGHIIPGLLVPSIVNGISGGFILGMCYLVCQRKSNFYAFLVTDLVHSAHNAVAISLSN